MKAIISDIHANLEALQAVLDDIAGQRADDIYCLGDVIGYGPNPRECLDLVRKCKLVLLGNHDYAALADAQGFNPHARRAMDWTRRQLDIGNDPAAVEDRWRFLAELPRTHREGDCLFVHGSPRNPLVEYVFPDDVHNAPKMQGIFARFERYCFVGHTHIPGVFTENGTFTSPDEMKNVYRFDGQKVLCNVGSVGQPRDGGWRACYILLDDDTIRYRHVEYDIETTIEKIKHIPDLENFLGS